MKKNDFKRKNTLILERLIYINKTPTPLNKEKCKPTFNFKKRKKIKGLTIEQYTIIKDNNINFKNRLKRQGSFFNLDKWKNDYKQAQHYKKNICSFPSIDFRKTFQSYFDKEIDKFKANFASNNLRNNC